MVHYFLFYSQSCLLSWIRCPVSLPPFFSTSISGRFRTDGILLRRSCLYPQVLTDSLQTHKLGGKHTFYSLDNWELYCSSINDNNYWFIRPLLHEIPQERNLIHANERREPWVDWYVFYTIGFSWMVTLQSIYKLAVLEKYPLVWLYFHTWWKWLRM